MIKGARELHGDPLALTSCAGTCWDAFYELGSVLPIKIWVENASL